MSLPESMGVEARGERPFTPYVISRFDLAQLRHLYPQVKAYNPDLADGLLARVIANIEKTYVADAPRVEAKPAPTFKNLDVVRHKRDGWIDTIVAIHERGDFVEYITRGQRVALPDDIEPAPSAPSHDAKGEGERLEPSDAEGTATGHEGAGAIPRGAVEATGTAGVPAGTEASAGLSARTATDPSGGSASSKGEGEKGVQVAVDDFADCLYEGGKITRLLFEENGKPRERFGLIQSAFASMLKRHLRAALLAAVDEAVRAAYARGVEAEAKRRERMGL